MKRFTFIIMLLAALLACTAFAEEATLLFEDNFDGTELNTEVWDVPEFTRGSACYWAKDCAFVDGEGNLVLYADWDAEQYMVRSASVRTIHSFQAGYGYYEMKAKLTNAQGALNLFHIVAGNMSDVADGAANGVDVYVVKGQRGSLNKVGHNFDWDGWGAEHKAKSVDYGYPGLYDGNYHTYGLLRHEGGYTFYIDHEVVWDVKADEVEACPLNGYLSIDLEFQPYSGFQPGAEEQLPTEMTIDYVKVWDKLPF